jgi:Ca2+-binding EF-hand superfamily protein
VKKANAIDDSVELRESPEDKALGSARKGLGSARKLEGFENAEEEAKSDEKRGAPEEIDESGEQEKPLEYRFLNLLKNQIRVDKKLEIQKEILCSNLQFSSVEAFRMFDQDGKGFVTEADLGQKFAELGLEVDSLKIIQRYDRDRDGKLSLSEFLKAITPISYEYQPGSGASYTIRNSYQGLSFRQSQAAKTLITPAMSSQLRSSEWIDDLKEVFYTITKAEEYLVNARNTSAIDATFIFRQIDQYDLGYISSRSLGEWLSENVGFKLNEFETRLVMNRYDKLARYSITLEDFSNEVQPI